MQQEVAKPSEDLEYFMKELDVILEAMQGNNNISLDKLLDNYEKGSIIIKKCEKLLEEAKLRIKKITEKAQSPDVEPKTETLF